MPSSWITKSDATEIRLAHPVDRSKLANSREAIYDLVDDPAFQDADKDRLALTLQTIMQLDLEDRILVRDLPDGDPDADADPARGEQLFWEGTNPGNRTLVARSTIVTVTWNGVDRFNISCRNARSV